MNDKSAFHINTSISALEAFLSMSGILASLGGELLKRTAASSSLFKWAELRLNKLEKLAWESVYDKPFSPGRCLKVEIENRQIVI